MVPERAATAGAVHSRHGHMEQQFALQAVAERRLDAILRGSPGRRTARDRGKRIYDQEGRRRAEASIGQAGLQVGGLELERGRTVQPRVGGVLPSSDGGGVRPTRQRHGRRRPRHHDALARWAYNDLGIQPVFHHGHHPPGREAGSLRCGSQSARATHADGEREV